MNGHFVFILLFMPTFFSFKLICCRRPTTRKSEGNEQYRDLLANDCFFFSPQT